MYHHESKSNLLCSRTAFPPERHLFLQGGNGPGDSGPVLSTDAKPRLKWTPELHQRFIEAVNQLGGPERATPKTVMRIMGIPGLTLYHLKSHLQKYRLSKNIQAQASTETNKNDVGRALAADWAHDEIKPLTSNMNCASQANKTMHISEALQMQIEVQRWLHEQLEVQRHLQLRIEAQGKYLQSVLEKARETLEKQNSASPELEAAKLQLSELVSKVSNERQITGMPCSQEASELLSLQDGYQKDQELHNVSLGLNTDHGYCPSFRQPIQDVTRFQQAQPEGFAELYDSESFITSSVIDSDKTALPVLSMNVDAHRDKASNIVSGAQQNEIDGEEICPEKQYSKRAAVELDAEKKADGLELPWLTSRLDLNASNDDLSTPACKKLDLNDFCGY